MSSMVFSILALICLYANRVDVSHGSLLDIKCPYANDLQHVRIPSVSIASSTVLDHDEPQYSNIISKILESEFYGNDWKRGSKNVKKQEKLQCLVPPKSCSNNTKNLYFRTFDGSCNNLQYPGFGMANERYSRILVPHYSDGVYSPPVSTSGSPLPNARLISLSLFGEDSHADKLRTMASMQWGQFVAHDISELSTVGAPSDCCVDISNPFCYPIYLHNYGPISQGSGKKCLNFARATSDLDAICPTSGMPHSEKISVVSAHLDLSSVYGNRPEQNNKIRLYKKGLLKTSLTNNRHWLPIKTNDNGECGENRNKCYEIPDIRNEFTPTIIVVHTLLQREHNRIAKILAHLNPSFSDDQLFEEARKINIAQYQKITYYDWLPVVLGSSHVYENQLAYYTYPSEYVNDYDPTVNAAPLAEYAAAAFRYAHNQIPGFISLFDAHSSHNETMRLSDLFNRDETIDFLADKDNYDSMIRGLAYQLHKRADGHIDKEVKHYFDRKAFEVYGSDLKAIDIQRGRDFGLPSYNEFREHCGLKRATNWLEFNDQISPKNIALLQSLYNNLNDVDLAVGGSLEKHLPNSVFGHTFQCIITKQFQKTRTGDRFFFENEDPYGGLKREQLVEIRKATLAGIICNNADYLQHIQENIFVIPSVMNILKSCHDIPQVDLRKWKY